MIWWWKKRFWDLRALWMCRHHVVICPDRAGWVLDAVAQQLAVSLPDECRAGISRGPDLHFLRNRVVHFLGQFDVFGAEPLRGVHPSNRLVATWWHGSPGSRDENVRAAFNAAPLLAGRLARIVVTCSIYEQLLRSAGIAPDRLVRLPLGVDTRRFAPADSTARRRARARFDIPSDAFCVGSFQKDGIGWGEGREPKLIKGPDVLVAALSRLADRGVFVVLAGPARGYVMGELRRRGIRFACAGHVPQWRLSELYHALDAYLITSREEGGPASLLEAMACGVPVVSTRVGMAADIIRDGENGFLAAVEDAETLAAKVAQLQEDSALRARVAAAAVATARGLDWAIVAREYYERLYRPLLQC